jgi:hypothetical protein
VRVADNLFSPVKDAGNLKGTDRFIFVRLAQSIKMYEIGSKS